MMWRNIINYFVPIRCGLLAKMNTRTLNFQRMLPQNSFGTCGFTTMTVSDIKTITNIRSVHSHSTTNDINKEERLQDETSTVTKDDVDELTLVNVEAGTGEDEYEDFVQDDNLVHEEVLEKIHPISLKRGIEGVFDVEEVVEVLREENGLDVCTIRVPENKHYVDYLVIVTGRSKRHLVAMAEYLRKLYKLKRSAEDPASVEIEGKMTKDWLALDLGNVAVHLFQADTRRLYDIESLWTVGALFDENVTEMDQSDPYAFLFDEQETSMESEDTGTENKEYINENEGELDEPRIESYASHSDKWHGTGP